MDRDVIANPPAVVRAAEDLSQLAAAANAAFKAAEDAALHSIQDYIAAGEALAKAKKLLGHGKWLKWVEKNLTFNDRQARKLMRLYLHRDRLANRNSNSDLTIDQAAAVLAERDEDGDGAGPPALRAGHVYFCLGTDVNGGPAFADVAAIPDAPEYWVWAFWFERGDFVDYCGRGMRLDGPDGLARLAKRRGFVPCPDGWQDFPYDPSVPPMAVRLDLLDRRQCKGRYAWTADLPAESREAMVRQTMMRWGFTEEPPGAAGGADVGRIADLPDGAPTGEAADAHATASPVAHAGG